MVIGLARIHKSYKMGQSEWSCGSLQIQLNALCHIEKTVWNGRESSQHVKEMGREDKRLLSFVVTSSNS